MILVPRFPREIGFPNRRYVDNEKSFFEQINANNGVTPCYYSVYDCNSMKDYHDAVIDKIFLDFDGEQALSDVLALHNALRQTHTRHLMLFSGNKGFHLYVFCEQPMFIRSSKKDVLYNAQTRFKTQFHLKSCDEKVFGDLARFGRFPNTLHVVSKLFCIPVSEEDLLKGLQFVKEKARKQNFVFSIYGNQLFSFAGLDFVSRSREVDMPSYEYYQKDMTDIKVTDEDVKAFLDVVPPCVRLWLENPEVMCTNSSRWYFAVLCRDLGIPPALAKKVAQVFWSNHKESHGKGRRTKFDEFCQERQLYYAEKKQGITMPSCEFLFSQGLCLGKCKAFSRGSFPIYLRMKS